MSIINYTSNERDLLARLMRAEAVGEGNLGMLMVGNVGVNRAIGRCLTFKNINTISAIKIQEFFRAEIVHCFSVIQQVKKENLRIEY